MALGGYADKVAWVDLTTGTTEFKPIPEEYKIKYVGFKVQDWYGFAIGAMFSGVIGVGLYPLMGSRVWCRFGCPMAAMLGLIQKLGRFRITVKNDMCISCGNCSTYCEMGIDVRQYAMANQSFTRSSCVGCGMCAQVCPRDVLKLENSPRRFTRQAIPLRAESELLSFIGGLMLETVARRHFALNLAAALFATGLSVSAASAQPNQGSSLTVTVSYPASLGAGAFDGRMLLLISKDDSAEPRIW